MIVKYIFSDQTWMFLPAGKREREGVFSVYDAEGTGLGAIEKGFAPRSA